MIVISHSLIKFNQCKILYYVIRQFYKSLNLNLLVIKKLKKHNNYIVIQSVSLEKLTRLNFLKEHKKRLDILYQT